MRVLTDEVGEIRFVRASNLNRNVCKDKEWERIE